MSLTASRDNIRRDLVFQIRDAVAQLKFAFFQSLQSEQVGCRRLMQRFDGSVQIAMFLLQPRKLDSEFVIVLLGH